MLLSSEPTRPRPPRARARGAIALAAAVREAARALVRHAGRSALNALGITVGVAAVICVAAIGQAAAEQAAAQLQDLGNNLVWVEAGARNANGVRTGSHGMNTLTLADADAIRREVPQIALVSPQVNGAVQVVHGDRNVATRYRGVSPEFAEIRRWRVARGALFTDDDVAHAARVVVLGETVRAALFGDEAGDPVGESIRIGRQSFQVIGVFAAKGQSPTGADQDDVVMLPYTTAQHLLRPRSVTWLDDVLCSAVSRAAVEPAGARVAALLRARHKIRPGAEDDFNIRRADAVARAQAESTSTFTRLLLAVAAVSLLVGGIGLMNMMLVSINERTREIGLRMALGATARAVLAQVLAEAVVVSVAAGMLGVVLSGAAAVVIERVVGWPVALPVQAVAASPVFSALLGVGFGAYPARRAARLDPIVAMRQE